MTTVAERSGWRRTGRYAEAEALCGAFAARYPGRVSCGRFGTTAEGRPMVFLAASADGALDPASARAGSRVVVMVQGGIHPGEIEGKDAGFWLLRELLDGTVLPGVLERVTLVFVPVFNPDGHERFGPNNRPNQNGPEEMGWRVTAQNLNLNRDYAKADTPEMAAMLALLAAWDPILYMDLHTTDGSKFEHDVAVLVAPTQDGPARLRGPAAAARDAVFKKLQAQGHLPIIEFYPALNRKDDPASGFSVDVSPPRFSDGYWPLRNRLAVLVETHSWKDYAARVRATRDVVLDFLELAAQDGAGWIRGAEAQDAEDRRGGPAEVALALESTGKSRPIGFRGYAYVREPSTVSGQPWIRYDDSAPRIWNIPLFDELRPAVRARLPKGGYVVPAAWAGLVSEKLKRHGFSCDVIAEAVSLPVEVFRATETKFAAGSVEGRQRLDLKGSWTSETRSLPAGSLYVPSAQRGARLLAHLLDPRGPDSLAAWGFFNMAFEQKEYMEDYVVEAAAREMLAKDPELKETFEAKLAGDPDFAKDSKARLAFFYRRHSSWDERKDLYPIYRTDRKP